MLLLTSCLSCQIFIFTNRNVFVAVQAGEYRLVGQMMAVAVVHGVLPCFLSERLYCLISGRPSSSPNIDEVDDMELREMLYKVMTSLITK